VVLATAFTDYKDGHGPVAEFLREGQRRHPNDFWLNTTLADFFAAVQPPQPEDAIRFAAAAVALRPRNPGARLNLGHELQQQGRLEEAIGEYRAATRIDAEFAPAHNNLGTALHRQGRLDEAVREYRESIRLWKDDAVAHGNLGAALRDKGLLDEAYTESLKAVRLNKDDARLHANLGFLLRDMGRVREAVAEYRKALALKQDLAEVHRALGAVLCDDARDYDAAIAEFQKALRLKPGYAQAHASLGVALANKGQLRAAVAEFRKAVRLDPDDAHAHYVLGNALRDLDRLDEAITELKEAVRLGEKFAEAHCNLGQALLRKGQFRQGAEALRRGHELGSRRPRWTYPSGVWLRRAERLAGLEGRLAAILRGSDRPTDANDYLALAWWLSHRPERWYAAAARLAAEGFTARPALADDLDAQHRYEAACTAALAGCGRGNDQPPPDGSRRRALRQQALDWLRADLAAYAGVVDAGPPQARAAVAQRLQHWQLDTDFAGVRGEAALAKFPTTEGDGWRKLWAAVHQLLARAQGGKGPAAPPKAAAAVNR
jgi:tetratricopeptide (TPR) repeat protein